MDLPNLLAVFVAAFFPMIIGALWYGPFFGNKWMELIGTTEEVIRASFNPLKSYGGSFVASLVMAFILALILQHTQAEGLLSGMGYGGLCWLGFILTFGWQAVAFEDKKLSLYGLSMAYNLVTLLAMGALLGAWQ